MFCQAMMVLMILSLFLQLSELFAVVKVAHVECEVKIMQTSLLSVSGKLLIVMYGPKDTLH